MQHASIGFLRVGVTRFELATSRPPDAHSNRTELHPVGGFQRINLYSWGECRNIVTVPSFVSACALAKAEYLLRKRRGFS